MASDVIFTLLEKEGYKNIPNDLKDYYGKIDTWKQWWVSDVKDFHRYVGIDIRRAAVNLTRKSLGMAKKVSEDWANLLLNDKTYIYVDDEQTQKVLTGTKDEQSGGILGDSKFWKIGNRAIEKAYALGTIAFILDLVEPKLVGGKLTAKSVKVKAIKDASKIIPLAYDDTSVKELAVYSTFYENNQTYVYIQVFKQVKEGRCEVKNIYYKANINAKTYDKVKYKEVVDSYYLPCCPFYLVTPAIENNMLDDVPIGISVYANAIDQLMSCDFAFDNLVTDFILGRKKVFVDQDMMQLEPIPVLDENGRIKTDDNGVPITRQMPIACSTIEQTLYYSLNNATESKEAFREYNPELRVQDNVDGIQFFLNLLSAKVGFGQQRYKFDVSNMNTATEARISNKDMTESVWKQRVNLNDVLVSMTKGILQLAKEICNLPVKVDTEIRIKFDDTMFTDEAAERLADLTDVREGVMAKYEYRMKYYGESEEDAKAKIAQIEGTSNEALFTDEDTDKGA